MGSVERKDRRLIAVNLRRGTSVMESWNWVWEQPKNSGRNSRAQGEERATLRSCQSKGKEAAEAEAEEEQEQEEAVMIMLSSGKSPSSTPPRQRAPPLLILTEINIGTFE